MLPMNKRGAAALTGGQADHRIAALTSAMPVRGAARAADDGRPLIAHVIFRLAVGGLENGLVNLINRMPQYRHAIICLTVFTDFHQRIRHDAVSLHALNMREGLDIAMFVQLWRLLRSLRPQLLHSRNLAALETQFVALHAMHPGGNTGEHGRDVHDLDGSNRKYRWLRRVFRPLVQRYIPLSRDLERYQRDLG